MSPLPVPEHTPLRALSSKKWLPDPGTYPLVKLNNLSRGGKWSQVPREGDRIDMRRASKHKHRTEST